MSKFLSSALVAVVALAFTAPGHAFLIDGFGDAQDEVRVTSTEFLGGTSTKTGSALAITDTDFVGAMRTLTATMTGTAGTGGIEADVGGGHYAHSQGSGVFGYTQVDWFGFDPVDFNPTDSILISLLSSDLGGQIQLHINGETLTRDLPEVAHSDPPANVSFALSDFSDVTGITEMWLRVDGTDLADLDLSIGQVEVASPGVIGLFGAGLLALGFVGRRRDLQG